MSNICGKPTGDVNPTFPHLSGICALPPGHDGACSNVLSKPRTPDAEHEEDEHIPDCDCPPPYADCEHPPCDCTRCRMTTPPPERLLDEHWSNKEME